MPTRKKGSRNKKQGAGGEAAATSYPSALRRSLATLREEADRRALHDLAAQLAEVEDAVGTAADREQLRGVYALLTGPAARECPTDLQVRQAIENYELMVRTALEICQDPSIARSASKNPAKTTFVLQLLGPKSPFDMGHAMSYMQSAEMMGVVSGGESDRKIEEFEKESPLDKYQRFEEGGFRAAKKRAMSLSSAEEANELGREAWGKNCKWTAEMFWCRAVDLDDTKPSAAKYRSNLAVARISLGRRVRSLGIGYRRLATELLEAAAADAARAVELDPKWERGYHRGAEAQVAIGPYDRAMDACRIIRGAMAALDEPSNELKLLFDRSKRNAALWCSLKPGTDIPSILKGALANLRSAVVRGLSADDSPDKDAAAKAGDDISNAMEVVSGALQLIYLRRDQWRRESKAAGLNTTDVQIQLREAAKSVPLGAVNCSDSLRNLVFTEGPYTFWGLDRLDRLGVDALPPDADDPCEGDEKFSESESEAEKMRMMQRGAGMINTGMDLFDVHETMEMFSGKGANSFERDATPHHICSFSVSVLERLVRADNFPLLQELAIKRIIDIVDYSNGLWAGGEFIGMALHVAAGIGKYGVPSAPSRTENFLECHGGVAALAAEINQSGDEHGYIQQVLANMTGEDWAKQSLYDISSLLVQYLLSGMDDKLMTLDRENISPFVADILSALLDGHPALVTYFRCGPTDESGLHDISAFLPLFKSPFGVFLSRQFMHYDRVLNTSRIEPVIQKIVQKWNSLSKSKRAAYNWESLDAQVKQELSEYAPVHKSELKVKRAKEKQDNSLIKAGRKLQECGKCGQKEGMGVVLQSCSACKATNYCSIECQKLHWPDHKDECKEIRHTKCSR